MSSSSPPYIPTNSKESSNREERELLENITTLQSQLIAAESRLAEQEKVNQKQAMELENKVMEVKHFEKRCLEKEAEIQRLQRRLGEGRLPSRPSTPVGGKFSQSSRKLTDSYTKQNIRREQASEQTPHSISGGNNIRFALEKCQEELEKTKEREAHLRTKIKVLEDALDFRSAEVGLAGQADLLSKVAKLKGEVSSLRSALGERERKLNEAEGDKSDLSTRHEMLQKQISLMQQRLAQSQQDAYRLANGVTTNILFRGRVISC